MRIGDWGLRIGDWGLGIRDWTLRNGDWELTIKDHDWGLIIKDLALWIGHWGLEKLKDRIEHGMSRVNIAKNPDLMGRNLLPFSSTLLPPLELKTPKPVWKFFENPRISFGFRDFTRQNCVCSSALKIPHSNSNHLNPSENFFLSSRGGG